MSMMGLPIPHDWTLGTGVLTGGSITIPVRQNRAGGLIQNQGASGNLTVTMQADNPNTQAVITAAVIVAPGATFYLNNLQFMTIGSIVITGTAGQACAILTY